MYAGNVIDFIEADTVTPAPIGAETPADYSQSIETTIRPSAHDVRLTVEQQAHHLDHLADDLVRAD